MTLSTRLSSIVTAASSYDFQHIWDCCCDHGYLGEALIGEHPNSHIHFVDVMPHIINDISARLSKHSQKNWLTHCADAKTIKLDENQSHLIIIAGVGGDLLIEMVSDIVKNHQTLIRMNRLDFILCPVRQLHKVRDGLNKLKLGLVDEKILHENNLFYEIIHVSNHSNNTVSLIGKEMWDLSNKQHMKYRNIMIHHYEKQPSVLAKEILLLYKNIASY